MLSMGHCHTPLIRVMSTCLLSNSRWQVQDVGPSIRIFCVGFEVCWKYIDLAILEELKWVSETPYIRATSEEPLNSGIFLSFFTPDLQTGIRNVAHFAAVIPSLLI